MPEPIESLVARDAIRDVARRYSRGVDRLDAAVMKSAYWPDAIDDHGVFVGNAWEFVDNVISSHARFRSTMHCIFNHSVELDDDGVTAAGEVYNVSYLVSLDGSVIDTWLGRYIDRYERRGDEWRIAHRVCVHEADQREQVVAMPIASERFRQGTFDRGAASTLSGDPPG